MPTSSLESSPTTPWKWARHYHVQKCRGRRSNGVCADTPTSSDQPWHVPSSPGAGARGTPAWTGPCPGWSPPRPAGGDPRTPGAPPAEERQQQDKRQAVQSDSLAARTIVPTFTINYYNPSFSEPHLISNSHSSAHGGSMEIYSTCTNTAKHSREAMLNKVRYVHSVGAKGCILGHCFQQQRKRTC